MRSERDAAIENAARELVTTVMAQEQRLTKPLLAALLAVRDAVAMPTQRASSAVSYMDPFGSHEQTIRAEHKLEQVSSPKVAHEVRGMLLALLDEARAK